MGRFIYHVRVKSKAYLGMKRKDKAIVENGNQVGLASTRDTKSQCQQEQRTTGAYRIF